MTDLYHIVCMPLGPSEFEDNVVTRCSQCDRAIMHRPDLPTPNVLMCMACAFDHMDAAEDKGDEIEIVATASQREELEAIYGKGSLEVGVALAEKMRRERRKAN